MLPQKSYLFFRPCFFTLIYRRTIKQGLLLEPKETTKIIEDVYVLVDMSFLRDSKCLNLIHLRFFLSEERKVVL